MRLSSSHISCLVLDRQKCLPLLTKCFSHAGDAKGRARLRQHTPAPSVCVRAWVLTLWQQSKSYVPGQCLRSHSWWLNGNKSKLQELQEEVMNLKKTWWMRSKERETRKMHEGWDLDLYRITDAWWLSKDVFIHHEKTEPESRLNVLVY